MNLPNPDELSNASMLELFRAEAETQTAILTAGLLELERGDIDVQGFEILMRAAHSLKGAARIVNLPMAVRVAHGLEDCFVAARQQQLGLHRTEVDLLLRGSICSRSLRAFSRAEASGRSRALPTPMWRTL